MIEERMAVEAPRVKRDTLEARVARLENQQRDHIDRITWLERERQWLGEMIAELEKELGLEHSTSMNTHPHELPEKTSAR